MVTSVLYQDENMKLIVSIPIVKKNSGTWNKYKTDGTLEIEFDGSEIDEQQVNTLLRKLDAQFLLIENNENVSQTIDELKGKLADTKAQLAVSRAQLHRLAEFLKGWGVNPRSNVLQFDESLKMRSAEIDRGDRDDRGETNNEWDESTEEEEDD